MGGHKITDKITGTEIQMPTQTQTPKERLGPQAPPPLTAGEGIVYSMVCRVYALWLFLLGWKAPAPGRTKKRKRKSQEERSSSSSDEEVPLSAANVK